MKRLLSARGLLAATAMSLATIGASPALARTNYAMLVAVTQYPSLQKKDWLVGPNHDAALVKEYLTTAAPVQFAPQNLTLLSDGLDGANGSPTRPVIAETLAEPSRES